ncbi:MAG: hypothetical protein GH159_00870 [Dehalococcoidia bacterium]|nr:hypothetical protein [Dehalococcoidia bacterium]
MRRLIILYAVILLVLLPVAGCQQQSPSLPDIESLTYTNSEYGFSVEYPKDWDILEDYMGRVVVFIGPSVLEETYYININISIEQLSEEMTLEDYGITVESNTQMALPDYNKVDEYSTTIGGQPATVSTLTATVELEGTEYTLKDSCAIFIEDSVGYIITYDVPQEFHDQYADCFELVIGTFEFD